MISRRDLIKGLAAAPAVGLIGGCVVESAVGSAAINELIGSVGIQYSGTSGSWGRLLESVAKFGECCRFDIPTNCDPRWWHRATLRFRSVRWDDRGDVLVPSRAFPGQWLRVPLDLYREAGGLRIRVACEGETWRDVWTHPDWRERFDHLSSELAKIRDDIAARRTERGVS